MGTTVLYSDPNTWIPRNFPSKHISPSSVCDSAGSPHWEKAARTASHLRAAACEKFTSLFLACALGFLKQRHNACLTILSFSVAQRVVMRLAYQWWYKLSRVGALECACCLWLGTCLTEHRLSPLSWAYLKNVWLAVFLYFKILYTVCCPNKLW